MAPSKDRTIDVQRIACSFLDLPGVEAILVYGSHGRGTADIGSSDLDALAVVDSEASATEITRHSDELCRATGTEVSVLPMTATELAQRITDRPSFGAHLAMEASLYTHSESLRSSLRDALDTTDLSTQALTRELSSLRSSVDGLMTSDRFSAAPITTLGRAFSTARALVIVRVLLDGHHVWDWKVACARLRENQPGLTVALDVLPDTRPFFDVLDGRIDVDDLQIVDSREIFERASEALRTLASASA